MAGISNWTEDQLRQFIQTTASTASGLPHSTAGEEVRADSNLIIGDRVDIGKQGAQDIGRAMFFVGELKIMYAVVASLEPSKGWFRCRGETFDGALYPKLKDYLAGTTLPDFRDRFPALAGSVLAQGATGGASTVTLTAAESGLPAHTHPPASGSFVNSAATTGATAGGVTVIASVGVNAATGTNATAAAANAHENKPPYLVAGDILIFSGH